MLLARERFAHKLRDQIVRPDEQAVLLATLHGSEESKDPYTQVNCDGLGRVRVFKTYAMHFGVDHPQYASRTKSVLAPGFRDFQVVRTQVFQLAACSWRCWYCYVDNELLNADQSRGQFVSASEMVDLYLGQNPRPEIIDLSGGQPDLVPEWPMWVLRILDRSGTTAQSAVVRSEDNLSNYWLWEYLTTSELSYLASHPKYVRIGCLKGFDESSFSFNTGDSREMYSLQFDVVQRLLKSGFDLYLHATFTSNHRPDMKQTMNAFLDRLQAIHGDLPLRVMPLKVRDTPAMFRRKVAPLSPLTNEVQLEAFSHWQNGLQERFTAEQLRIPIGEVRLAST
jgi:uncharacterized Fe-S cluster-containing radical SAM superfamily protein